MQFSDTTNNTGILQMTRRFLGMTVSSTIYSAVDVAASANRWYQTVVGWILEAHDEWHWDDTNNTTYPIATTALVANQQDYVFPAGILKVLRVEVQYTTGGVWEKAEPFHLKERGRPLDTTTVAADFSTSKPFYEVKYGSVWLYPIPSAAVTGGLKIWFKREVSDVFTSADTTQQPGFDEQFHDILALGAAFDYALAKGVPNIAALRQEIEQKRIDLFKHYSRKQEDRELQLKLDVKNYK